MYNNIQTEADQLGFWRIRWTICTRNINASSIRIKTSL